MKSFFVFFVFVVSSVFAVEIVGKEDLSEGVTTCRARLDNGLEVYLVSDPKMQKGAVGLAVEAGSFNDPKEHPGMAHFLEHLLFMGSEAYPDEKDFMEFINDRGGMTNAFTMHDRTVYGFSMYEEWFDETLDRFAHFFIDPLFTESAIQREMCAVDHEFGDHYDDDFIRTWRILKQTGRQDHPNAVFSIGNLDSLKTTTHKSVKRWFDKHYIANKMHLTLLSQRPMEQIMEQVEKIFSVIPSGPSTIMPLSGLMSSVQLGSMIYIEPVRKNQKVLDIIWEVPSKFASDNERACSDLVIEALENGEENGLLALLRKEDLARNISVGDLKLSKYNLLFDLEVSLTDKGVKNTDLVISRIFEAIAKLKELGVPKYMFDDFISLNSAFQFFRRNPFTLAMENAEDMIDEDLETFPERSRAPSIYDPLFIKEFINCLTPQACIYFVLADPKITEVKPDMLEKWMGGRFSIQPISEQQLQSWRKALPHPQIGLPSPLPEDKKAPVEEEEDEDEVEPVVLEDDSLGYVEFEYKNEEVELDLLLEVPELDGTPSSKVLTAVFIKAVYEKLNELIDDGLEFDFFVSQEANTFNITVTSLADNSLHIMSNVFKKFKKVSVSEKDFIRYKEALIKRWEREFSPYDQAQDILENVFFKDHFTYKKLLETITPITYKQFSKFGKSFLSSAYIVGNLSGNLEVKAATNLWMKIRRILAIDPLAVRPPSFDFEKPFLPAHFTETTSRTGSACILLIEEGEHTLENWAAHEVIGTILNNDFFDDLRTKQQTGYLVEAQQMVVDKVLYQCLAAQSSTHNAQDLLERFEDFVERFGSTFPQRVSPSRFADLKTALLKGLEKQLDEIDDIFDLIGIDDDEDVSENKDALESLTYEELCSAAETFFLNNPKKLSILIEGKLRGLIKS